MFLIAKLVGDTQIFKVIQNICIIATLYICRIERYIKSLHTQDRNQNVIGAHQWQRQIFVRIANDVKTDQSNRKSCFRMS